MVGAKLVAFVGTRQPGKAREFYGGVLGLTLVSEDNFALTFEGGGATLRVSVVPELTPAKFTVLGWSVGDIASSVRSLRTKGVVFERFPGMAQDELGIWTSPGGARVAWFRDPDGNLLSLSEGA